MWEPISENELLQLIKSAETDMEPPVNRFWARIRIKPQKWSLSPWGDKGNGFWVVALIGQECIYYNDIEDGFNISRFSTLGYIDDYWCSQTELMPCIRSLYQAFMCDIGELSVPNAIEQVNALDGIEMYRSESESIDPR